jgi:transcriptional regulator with XRE-family HTH domain
MILGKRIRKLREAKNLSQADIEKRTGLLRSYISRVENGHTVPSLETLETLAAAVEVPLYQLFYEGDDLPEVGADSRGEIGVLNRIRRIRERNSEASDDARLAFRTLAKVFSML